LHEDLSDTYVYMMPLEGPGGVQFADYKPFRRYGLSRAGITSAARYPAAAYKFLDQLYELELTLWNRYGVPGEDWRYPDEGELDDMGRPAGITMLRDVWGTEGEVVHWHSAGPQWMPDGFNGYEHNAIPEEVAEREASGWQPGENSMHASSIDYTAYAPPADMYVPPLAIALESIETYNEIKSSLDTFVEESRTRFIVGDMDIETEWDTYLSGLENIGLDRLLEIMQEAYAEAY
jgi:putative aldouronate transport system substrate-binding protein